MADSDFKPFATGPGAYVLTQAEYEALLATVVAFGFNSGTAVKEQLNKVWRQSSFASAVLMKFVADELGTDSLDDGDLAAHVVRLRDALSVGSTNPVGSSIVRGLSAVNNAGFLTTKMDITASRAQFVDVNGKILVRDITATYTCDTGLGGPAENGRDQAGAFGANSWLYFYLILDPIADTIATIVSTEPPETFDGSTLPGDYSYWAFAYSQRFDGSSQLERVAVNGNRVGYPATKQVLSSGSSTSEVTVDCSSVVPEHASHFSVRAKYSAASGGAIVQIGYISGVYVIDGSIGVATGYWEHFEAMNVSQELFYDWDFSSGDLSLWVTGYTIPNGG